MAIIRAQVTFRHNSGLPEDEMVNVWHFDVPTGDFSEDIADALEAFYDAVPDPSANSVGQFMSDLLDGQATITMYNLNDTPPRVPIHEHPFTITTGSGALPSEVALCASFHAPAVSGLSQAHRRGRVYIGPLAPSANNTAEGRPLAAFRLCLARSLRDLIAASLAQLDWSLAVYSPTLDTASKVEAGWVDNAFDTQRRRGENPTSRELVTSTLPA